jgi:hypothetical protein
MSAKSRVTVPVGRSSRTQSDHPPERARPSSRSRVWKEDAAAFRDTDEHTAGMPVFGSTMRKTQPRRTLHVSQDVPA